jgi:hypothetical protein
MSDIIDSFHIHAQFAKLTAKSDRLPPTACFAQAGDIFHKLEEIEQMEAASERTEQIVSIREKLQVSK